MNRPCALNQTAIDARREELLAKIERLTELPLMILAFAMVPLLAAPLFWNLSPRSDALVLVLDALIWALFAADLVVKVAVAPDRLRYIKLNWLDVLVVLVPFARPLRLVRVILYGSRAYRGVIRLVRADFLLVYAIGLVLLVATGITFVEKGRHSEINSFSDALWWAVATVTTVGYGDIVPVTHVGRALAYVLMIGGIGIFGALTANFASILVRSDDPYPDRASLLAENRALQDELERLRGAAVEQTSCCQVST